MTQPADTIELGRTDPAPAAWVEAVTALYVEHDLPALLVDPADVARGLDGSLQLHPWALRRDVDALLRWATHLSGTLAVFGYRGHLKLVGQLAGEPTALCGVTHRLGDGLDAVTLERLAAVRRDELAERQDLRDDYPLTLEQQADPLCALAHSWFGTEDAR